MKDTRVKISSIVQNQLPDFILEEYPLVSEFLKEYYNSLEIQGGTLDILQNIDQYLKVDELFKSISGKNITVRPQSPQVSFEIPGGYSIDDLLVYKNGTKLLKDIDYFATDGSLVSLTSTAVNGDILEFFTQSTLSTFLSNDLDFVDDVIEVSSTYGFPDKNGLIQIDSEIILYKEKTETTFKNCVRGFSGTTSYRSYNKPDQLVFSTSSTSSHTQNTKVVNLSSLFLNEFLDKIKKQLIPGFENKEFADGVNQKNFIKQIKDFYLAKGTDESYKLLFKAFFGEKVEIIKPKDYLLKPSDAQYRVVKDLVVEVISGNPENLENKTLYQDETNFSKKSYGTITKVEKIQRQNKTYYTLSLDYDYDKDLTVEGTVYGDFSIHPSTKLVSDFVTGNLVFDVDSTIGFPESGELIFNVDGVDYTVLYNGKNVTQFFVSSSIEINILAGTELKLNEYAYGYDGDSLVKVRVTGVVSDILYAQNNYLMSKGDIISTSTLGYDPSSVLSNNWIFNIANNFSVKKIVGPTLSNVSLNIFSYNLSTYDAHSFSIGDSVTLLSSTDIENTYKVVSINNEYSISIQGPKIENINLKFTIKRKLKKPKFTNYTLLNQYAANIQNIYLNDENQVYIAANSLPNYLDENIEIPITDIVFSGSFDGETLDLSSGNPNNFHGLYTGDSIRYIKNTFQDFEGEQTSNVLNILDKVYYVKRIDSTKIKISNSKSDLFKNRFVSVSGSVVNNIFRKLKYQNLSLSPQNYVKTISSPLPTPGEKNIETPVGPTGILVNGVEIYNYKSLDKIYYGGIESLNVLNGGDDYDVINPPTVIINDSVGYGVSSFAHVSGSLNRIEVIDGGFDYVGDPTITITGGNGYGAYAKPNLTSIRHSVSFNSVSTSQLVDLTNNTIGFSSYHKFRDYEKVVYQTNNQTNVGGLSNGSQYYVSVQDAYKVKLHTTLDDAVLGINTINLTSYGAGIHEIQSFESKRKISSISVLSSGSGYQNKKTYCSPTGINTASNTINIKNHGYNTGEILVYSTEGTSIGGLSNNDSYYVTKINENEFKLSLVGIASTNKDFYYKTNQFINLTSIGSSYHSFNYPSINVSINGKIGVSTLSGQNFGAKIQPIFRGKVDNVFVKESGVGYGSSEIINYERQPSVTLGIGSGAQISPIVNNGKISQVLILNSGNNYTSPPKINHLGIGTGAIFTPIVKDGKLVEVKVISGGTGFNTTGTYLNVIPAGKEFKSECKIKSWTINNVERYLNDKKIFDDDGVIQVSQYTTAGLQYCHLYTPRKLRRSVFGIDYVNGTKTFVPDLKISGNREVSSNVHSPIVGWAYDGNPIYGPYGYSDPSGSSEVKLVTSGYVSEISPSRPNPISSSGERIYPEGFFIEDYTFNNSGDLDEHNGRFCVTPEYPNGTYAYFTTINNGNTETDGTFKNYRKPVFPYLIGNTFKSNIISFNYNKFINQNSFNFNREGLLRNTKPYNLRNKNSGYEFIFNPLKVKKPISTIKSVTKGSIKDIGITTGGSGYKVGDTVAFNNNFSGGSDAYAQVSYIKGKPIKSISFASTSFQGVELYPYNNTGSFIGFCTSPHSFANNDLVSLSGISTSLKVFDGFFEVGVRSDTLILSSAVANSSATGIVTYFNVIGSLSFPNIRENDIYKIGSEKIKILSIDPQSSRIKVSREYDSTTGSAHTASTVLYEQTRKFSLNLNQNISNKFDFNINREVYFNPKESLSIGSSSGVGIGSTLYFSNPGVGITNIFVPTKTIYLPNHPFNTGDELVYSSNGGSPFYISDDGSNSFQLSDNQTIYAAKISDNLIGISTYRVGLGSTGSFVGIDSSISVSTLYFTNVGSGNNHSFKTNYNSVLTAEVEKNIVTVSTSSTHGLSNNDLIFMNSQPGITTTVVVKYNDKHRRLVINPRSFNSSDVDITNNTILIPNHLYFTGQKIIYTATVPITGLSDNEIYYAIRITNDRIKLSPSYYGATKDIPEVISLDSASSGTLSPINPNIKINPNINVIFNLSDSSLSFSKDLSSYPAFDFKLYTDPKLTQEFKKTQESSSFDLVKNGRIGVDSFCTISLNTSNLNQDLYYNLIPVDLLNNNLLKKEIIIDDEYVYDNNKISIVRSSYSGKYIISGVGQTTFKYNILTYPEKTSYAESDGFFEYYTNSKTADGAISQLDLKYGGREYSTLPGITFVSSENGSNSILQPNSNGIGVIKNIEIDDIGFEYPCDLTLRPSGKLPQILKVDPLSTFDYIGISSVGINYTLPPNLVVIDSYTNNVVSDVDLKFNAKFKNVEIIKNTDGIYGAKPKIIPVNNSNGIPISNITFNGTTKNVTVELGVSFSYGQVFPFNVGDEVLVENVSVGSATTAKGYNSKNYNYALFTVTSVNPQYGGSGATIVYNLSNYLSSSESPGSFDSENSSGVVVPKKYFPVFNPVLKKGKFLKGEKVLSNSKHGYVISWNEYSEQLKISSEISFDTDFLIRGETSNSKGIITSIEDFNAIYTVSSSSIVKKGWNRETGFLNNKFQVTSDNDYYQYFSYSIKSKIDYETWNESIGNMNHTVGFKKFSDLNIESIDSSFTGISTFQDQGNFLGIADIISEIDLNCIKDFDLAREKTITINSESLSSEILFNTVSLQDEFQSIGNRVLLIDDISSDFSNIPSGNNYSNVNSFNLSDFRFRKYVTYVRDKRFTGVRQIYLVSLLHDGLEGYLNQYGRIDTFKDIGSFDFSIFGSEGTLRFYPIDYTINDYNVSFMSYGISDAFSGIGSTSLGNIATIKSSTTTVPTGTSTQTNIVGIASTYRSSKLLIQFNSSNGSYFESDEITLINDGSEVYILEYGQLSNANRIGFSGTQGIGTYSAYISGSLINLDFTPNVGLGTTYVVNTLSISIASTVGTNNGTLTFDTGEIKSTYVSIAATSFPVETKISTYGLDHSGAYYFVVIEDTTNNAYESCEVVVVDDDTETYISDFGYLQTVSGLGTIGAGIGSTGTSLYFTPNPGISVDVKVYQHAMRIVDTSNTFNSYSLTNASINSGYSEYKGTLNAIKRSFDLYHKETPIFQRFFDASNPLIVNISKNTIRIPNHFFVTGEEIVYDNRGGTSIGIATTTISGIGSTDKLPSKLFVIKESDLEIKLTDTAENALKSISIPLTLRSVGIGTTHTFTSKKQNTKCLVSIDNYIQSPIVSTSTTSRLSTLSQFNENTLTLVGISSIFGGDLLQIDDEIVKVSSVGYGGTNIILVDRGWMGTEPENHIANSLVTKVVGNYNIIDNTIHFVEAPYGNFPIGTITNSPDSRDYTGITTRSTFSGRVFLRSGIENGNNDPYDKNYIFDGLSEKFTGISTEFTLKSSGLNVTGVSTGSIITLVNNIFQEPQRLGGINIQGDYKMSENSGITTLSFTGNISSTSYDVNTASIPRGGVIVSVASTQGFGYQPLISAGGTSVVSSAGTINSISVGYSGSGYRGSNSYELITQTSTSVASGSTIIPINNVNGVFKKLPFSSSNTIGIGSIFVNVPIVSVANTYVTIGVGYTSSQSINSNTSVLISLNSPTVGFVDVGVKTSSTGVANYEFIGFSTISSGHISTSVTITNPGSGYTTSNPPIVVFDSPLSYSNIPLIYSSGYSGIGTSATVDIVVGQGSSVIDFEIKNLGYAYKVSEVLTIPTGGLTGIPTDVSKPFRKFELTIDEVFSDLFAAWSVGDFQVIDKIENLFNNTRTTFPIKINGLQTSIKTKVGSNIDAKSVLLIFINDILQVPGSGYTFNGGSVITFTEAPKENDTCKILFYKGTGDVDVVFFDILESVKIGDNVTLESDIESLKEDERVVTEIIASDTIKTNSYYGPGLSLNENILRPLSWCRQTEDKIINGREIGKDRIINESLIQPTTNIIRNVGIASTEIFVESVKIFFDDLRENSPANFKSKILIVSQDNIVGASASAVVSAAGTISSILVLNGGSGFTTSPTVTISNPVGIATTTAAATASITSGVVTSFTITNPGFGYTSSTPPQILIEYPTLKSEKIENVTYEGDFGIIVGVKTTSVGVASTGIVFDLFVPVDSYLRNLNINVGVATTGISGIKTDYYFKVFNSNIGFGITSLDSNSSIVGVGTSYLDNIYKVASVSIAQTSVPGIGLTSVSRVIVSALNYNGLTGTGFSNFYGEFTWGKINTTTRKFPKTFEAYTSRGITGLSTAPIVQRINPLKYVGYSTNLQ